MLQTDQRNLYPTLERDIPEGKNLESARTQRTFFECVFSRVCAQTSRVKTRENFERDTVRGAAQIN